MYKRMLVTLDGSKLAEVVFSYAKELAGRMSLELDLLHVCTSQEAEQLPMRQAYIEHMAELLKAQSQEICSKAGGSPSKCVINVRGKIVVGYPAEEILKYADENNIDVIMLATHGRTGVKRWALGSVADKVIHEAKMPCWLVPTELHEDILFDRFPQNLILVPLDGSKLAEAVIPHVKEIMKQRGVATEIMLINVAKPSNVSVSGKDKDFLGEDLSALKTTGELYLKGIAEQLKSEGFKAQAEQLVGDPAEEIVRYAAEYHPRFIAMSTHGRSGFSRFVFGSVTENVLRRLRKTPVFLIRPPEQPGD